MRLEPCVGQRTLPPDGWSRPQAHPMRFVRTKRLRADGRGYLGATTLKLLNRGEFFRRQIRA